MTPEATRLVTNVAARRAEEARRRAAGCQLELGLDAIPADPETACELAPADLLMVVRSIAQSKPFKGGKRMQTDEGRLLAVLEEHEDFTAIVRAMAGPSTDAVFRDLCRLRERGLVADYGPDLWALTRGRSRV